MSGSGQDETDRMSGEGDSMNRMSGINETAAIASEDIADNIIQDIAPSDVENIQEPTDVRIPEGDDQRLSMLVESNLTFGIKSIASRGVDEKQTEGLEKESTSTNPLDDNKKTKDMDVQQIAEHEKPSVGLDERETNPEFQRIAPSKDHDTKKEEEIVQGDSIQQDEELEECDHVVEDEDEPKLKYERLGASEDEIFKKDAASALAIHERFIAVGTHNGALHILDLEGNEIKRFNDHSATVYDISIDKAGEYVGTASMDGNVVIQGLYTDETSRFNYRRPVRCIALDPGFSRKNTKQFVSGGTAGQLVLNEKGWLGNKDTVLHSGEGPIMAVQWQNNLIAWANEFGIKIYSTVINQRITYIEQSENSPRPDLYRCNLCWKDDETLIIAWANSIRIAKVREKNRAGSAQIPSALYVEITSIFETDYIVAGISPLDDSLLVLAYLTETEENTSSETSSFKRKPARRPELRIIDAELEEISADALSIHGYELLQGTDYVMGYLCPDLFYILSPKDLVVAKTRDMDDHVEWLLDNHRYEHALDLVMRGKGLNRNRFNIQEVGKRYLESLINEGNYELAAQTCRKVFGRDVSLWETWIFRFAELNELKTIAPYVPTRDPQLGETVYELILAYFLNTDRQELLRLIKEWPPTLYDVASVISVLNHAYQADLTDRIVMECLVDLYMHDRQPALALEFSLRLGRSEVFDLIQDYNLFDVVREKVVLLLEFERKNIEVDIKERKSRTEPDPIGVPKIRKSSQGRAVQLLVEHTHSIPIHNVVAQIEPHPIFLYAYLDALFDKDPNCAFEFHDYQIDLYAEYDYPKLMDFLRGSSSYSFQKALSACSFRDLVPEMVYILGRMGDNKRALMLIIERLGDVERAISFAKEQNDDELWDDLLTYSMDKPDFIRGLLENVGTNIDPIRLIRRIPEGLEIPDLRPALLKILDDYASQLTLSDACYRILMNESKSNSTKLIKELKRGLSCDVMIVVDGLDICRCMICQKEAFIDPDGLDAFQTLIFNCHHAMHKDCFETKESNGECPICREQQKTIDAI